MFRKALMAVLGAALAIGVLAIVPSARADQRDQAAKLTFNQSVELPGNTVLPAGTYWFMVETSRGDSNVVDVYNADQSEVIGTFVTNSVVRHHRTDKVILNFAEPSTTGQPLTLLSWYYPDRMTGHQFIYSSSKEAQLSAGVHITVDARNAS